MEREMGKKKMTGEGKAHLMCDALSFFFYKIFVRYGFVTNPFPDNRLKA